MEDQSILTHVYRNHTVCYHGQQLEKLGEGIGKPSALTLQTRVSHFPAELTVQSCIGLFKNTELLAHFQKLGDIP